MPQRKSVKIRRNGAAGFGQKQPFAQGSYRPVATFGSGKTNSSPKAGAAVVCQSCLKKSTHAAICRYEPDDMHLGRGYFEALLGTTEGEYSAK